MTKLYALRVLHDNESNWSDVIACSHEIDKLTPFIYFPKGRWRELYSGSYDKHNNSKIVRYTHADFYPRYVIEEIPYVI